MTLVSQEEIEKANTGELLGYVLVTVNGTRIDDRVFKKITDAENNSHLGIYIAKYVK